MSERAKKGWSAGEMAALGGMLLLGTYVGSYFLLVSAELEGPFSDFPWPLTPEYRMGGEFSKTTFHPIQQLDERLLRPEHWRFTTGDLKELDRKNRLLRQATDF